uniref:putative nuclease HARBI1 n=1 Tax=Myxine glutinosa TaxID=7769 RepID=UPI00358EEE5F
MNELRLEDINSFQNFVRMPPALFDEILHRITPRIEKEDTRLRKALQPGMKLAITLRHLATGDLYPTLSYDFRVSRNTIVKFIPEVCQAIVAEFKEEMVKCPTTPEEWTEVADDFESKWNIPHVLGALDGKHVALRCAPNSGSVYHNYKGFFSIVLMALVDADYKFLWVDVGGMGHMSDAQILNASELKECIENETIGFPDPLAMRNDDEEIPFFILGDDAFALRTYLMKPYARRGLSPEQLVYNYRISRGRRVVENAFGILANRWQCLLKTLQQYPEVVRDLVETAICLHNMLRIRLPSIQHAEVDQEDYRHNIIPGEWRDQANMLEVEQAVRGNRDSVEAKRQREVLRLYFNSPAGAVPWQERMVRHH